MLLFDSVGPKIELSEIVTFAAKFSIMLPQRYTQFLLNTNGGVPRRKTFLIEEHFDGTDCIDAFLSISTSNENLSLEYHAILLHDYLRHGMLTIAFTDVSSVVCVDLHRGNRESIAYIDVGDELDSDGMKCWYHLADNLDDFLAGLREE